MWINTWQANLAIHQTASRPLSLAQQQRAKAANKVLGEQLQCLIGLVLLLLCSPLQATQLVMNFFIEPPFVSHGDENFTGLHVDIFQQLQQQQSNLSIKIQLLPLKRAYLLSSQLPNNCVFGIERTPARETDFVWVSPLYTSRYAFYQRPQHKQNLNQLKHHTIGSYLGSGVAEYLEMAGYRVDLAKTNLNSAKKLQRKRVQAWASDVLSAAYIFQHHSLNISPQGQPFYTTERAIACNKNTSLDALISLHQGLDQLHHSGAIASILNRYQQQYQVNLSQ